MSEATDEPEVEVEVEVASRSDVGRVRSDNEDACDTFVREDGARLLVVADGMGGHRGGGTASQMAVATISERFADDPSNEIEELIRQAILAANSRIFELAQRVPDLQGMGTTVVALLLDSRGRGTVAHVGDSRAYRIRRGQLEALTIDHSVVAEMHRRGLLSQDEAATHPRRNEILRSVGVVSNLEVDIAAVEVRPGDRFLLCSDGLSGVVGDEEIAAIVAAHSPEVAVDELIAIANERGGPDNISVQILSIPKKRAGGDSESTASLGLAEFGVQEIAKTPNEKWRARSIVAGLIALVSALGLYFACRAL